MSGLDVGWYFTGAGRRVEVLSVGDVRAGSEGPYFEVAAYRYEGKEYIHIRETVDMNWTRVPETTLEDRVAGLERRLREMEKRES